jgi:hypothetical protein
LKKKLAIDRTIHSMDHNYRKLYYFYQRSALGVGKLGSWPERRAEGNAKLTSVFNEKSFLAMSVLDI